MSFSYLLLYRRGTLFLVIPFSVFFVCLVSNYLLLSVLCISDIRWLFVELPFSLSVKWYRLYVYRLIIYFSEIREVVSLYINPCLKYIYIKFNRPSFSENFITVVDNNPSHIPLPLRVCDKSHLNFYI